MKQSPFLNQVLSVLWPENDTSGAPLWAILDAAIDDLIVGEIEKSRLNYCSLFPGRLDPEMKNAAPYLVQLRPGHAFTETIISKGWERHWGVFLQSQSSMEDLRRHLKELLRVQTEDGQRLYFRYYDPRVLRVYLPTCTPEELAVFFGPVLRFAMEDKDPGYLMELALRGRELHQRKVALCRENQSGSAASN